MAERDELNELWCGQTPGPPIKGEDMMTIAMERANRFDRTIKARNLREIVAGLIVAGFFGFVAWQSPNTLSRAGHLLVAASGLWVVFYMLRFGREEPAPAPERSVADFQQALVRKYDHQIRLLKRVKYWYVLPPYVGLVMASAGMLMADAASGRPVWPQWVAMGAYSAVFGTVWWLNEVHAVGKLRAERDRLLKEMEG